MREQSRVSVKLRLGIPSVGIVLAMLFSAGAAWAQGSEVARVEVHFWAYSSNPQFYAYHTTNHLEEQVFFVGQAGAPDPVYTQVVAEDQEPVDIVTSQAIRDLYHWAADGIVGASSPSGFSTIEMTAVGPVASITVNQSGRRPTPLGSVQLLTADDGITVAMVEVRDAYWSPDESVIVIVLHQSLTGAWPLEIDTVHAFLVPARPEEEGATP